MNKTLLANRYAKALYEFSNDLNESEFVLNKTRLILDSFIQYPELNKFLADPLMDKNKKKSILNEIIGQDNNLIFDRFFSLLLKNKREVFMKRICRAYINVWNIENNIQEGDLYSTYDLNDESLNKIKNIFQPVFPSKKIILNRKIDKNLIGGFMVQMGTYRVDASVKYELNEIFYDLMTRDYMKKTTL